MVARKTKKTWGELFPGQRMPSERKAFAITAKARSKAAKKKVSKGQRNPQFSSYRGAWFDGRKWHVVRMKSYAQALSAVQKAIKEGAESGQTEGVLPNGAWKVIRVINRNPRGRHLSGATAKQQRQYEAIKKSERKAGVPLKEAKRIAAATVRSRAKNKTIIKAGRIDHLDVSKIHNPGKTTRRKYRNGYIDLVIMGHATKMPDGWRLGGKTFKQGKGIVPASRKGYYLDRATGTVFSKKARNPQFVVVATPKRKSSASERSIEIHVDAKTKAEALKAGHQEIKDQGGLVSYYKFAVKVRNLDHRDAQHPIHVTDYWQGRKGYLTPWQRAHKAGQQGLFEHGIKARNGKKGSGSQRQRKHNPRYFVTGITAEGREHDLAIHVDANKTQTLAWAKRQYPGYKKYVVELSDKADFIGRSGMVKVKRPKRLSSGSQWQRKGNPSQSLKKRNPSPADNRREFAGSYSGDKKLYFPDGTPSGLSKLGVLKLLRTEAGTIKPYGNNVWLCRDQAGKLHLGTTKENAILFSGPAQSLGEVTRLEYQEAKPHLGYANPVVWFHKLGEETGERPTLHSDGKGGLRFRGGKYKIEARGIVN
jgi:hypothetical protein